MRVLSLNLQHGLSSDGSPTSAEQLADALAPLRGEVDVVALQEVDRGQPRSDEIDQAQVVSQALGLEHVRFAATLGGDVRGVRRPPVRWGAEPGPGYGLALASRWPFAAWFVRPVPRLPLRHPVLTRRRLRLREDEQRGLLAAVLQSPDGPVGVGSAHLSLLGPVAAVQLAGAVRAMATLPSPTVLCGDLNSDPWAVGPLARGWELPRALTFPAARPRRQIDHVLLRGAEVVDVRAERLAISDHLGLLVTLDRR